MAPAHHILFRHRARGPANPVMIPLVLDSLSRQGGCYRPQGWTSLGTPACHSRRLLSSEAAKHYRPGHTAQDCPAPFFLVAGQAVAHSSQFLAHSVAEGPIFTSCLESENPTAASGPASLAWPGSAQNDVSLAGRPDDTTAHFLGLTASLVATIRLCLTGTEDPPSPCGLAGQDKRHGLHYSNAHSQFLQTDTAASATTNKVPRRQCSFKTVQEATARNASSTDA